jgi:tRNA (Thr-GGU) A37 N-methylase
MKFYDVEQEAQEELVDSVDLNDDTPVMDRKQKYSDFKV